MTLDERIEAAARARFDLAKEGVKYGLPEIAWGQVRDAYRDAAEGVLRAAFPELFASPPTHWIAPMTPTDEMIGAPWTKNVSQEQARIIRGIYDAMRDAYLNREGE